MLEEIQIKPLKCESDERGFFQELMRTIGKPPPNSIIEEKWVNFGGTLTFSRKLA